MRVRTNDPELADALATAGPEHGLIFQVKTGLNSWTEAEDELAHAFELSRTAALDDAPVVFLVRSEAIVGRAAPLVSAVATGLLGGARAIAFERRKSNGYATVVAVADDVGPERIASAIDLLVTSRGANGQIFALGAEHLGAALP